MTSYVYMTWVCDKCMQCLVGNIHTHTPLRPVFFCFRPAHEMAANPPGPAPPTTVLEAMEQRMAKYRETCDKAKTSGDERKARMYDRIIKVIDHVTR